jgi:hypothetical protein
MMAISGVCVAGRQHSGRRIRWRRQIAFECSGLGAGAGLSPTEVASIKGSLYVFARPRPEKYSGRGGRVGTKSYPYLF